jgi:hypothetical protein
MVESLRNRTVPVPRITIQEAMLGIAVVACGVFVAMNWPSAPRETHCVWHCQGRLYTVSHALADYHDRNHAYPSGTYLNTNLAYEDRLSWYAKLLPELDNEAMHQLVSWDQPWNAGFNNKISSTVLKSLICENQDGPLYAPRPTSYIGIAGVGANAPILPKSHPKSGVFGYDRVTTQADVKDGLANTMIVAETSNATGSWLQGGPATVRGLDPANMPYLGPYRQFGGLHKGGVWVAMADGSVRFIDESIAPEVFEALATMAGGKRRLPRKW